MITKAVNKSCRLWGPAQFSFNYYRYAAIVELDN